MGALCRGLYLPDGRDDPERRIRREEELFLVRLNVVDVPAPFFGVENEGP